MPPKVGVLSTTEDIMHFTFSPTIRITISARGVAALLYVLHVLGFL